MFKAYGGIMCLTPHIRHIGIGLVNFVLPGEGNLKYPLNKKPSEARNLFGRFGKEKSLAHAWYRNPIERSPISSVVSRKEV